MVLASTIRLALFVVFLASFFFNAQSYVLKIASLGFILQMLLKFRKFRPRHSYEIYSCKKRMYVSLRVQTRAGAKRQVEGSKIN